MVQLTRRKFLIATGCVAGGATVLYTLGTRAAASAPTIIFPNEESGAAWIQIRPDGSCHMYFPRQDMGQNANTGLAQIVAEELNIHVTDIQGVRPQYQRCSASCCDSCQHVPHCLFTPDRFSCCHAA